MPPLSPKQETSRRQLFRRNFSTQARDASRQCRNRRRKSRAESYTRFSEIRRRKKSGNGTHYPLSCRPAMDPAVGAAPAPPLVAAVEGAAAATAAAYAMAALHTRVAFVRGGPRPQRTLGWDPPTTYPRVTGAQNALGALAQLFAQANGVGASPAGLQNGRGGGGGGGGGGGRGGAGGAALTPAAAQQALLGLLPGMMQQAELTPAQAPGPVRFFAYRHELRLMPPGSDLRWFPNNSLLLRNRCPLVVVPL